MAKIPKANMMSVVLEAIRLLLDDSGSNISAANLTKILGLSASSIGNILPADLASVLGVNSRIQSHGGANDKTYSLGICDKFQCIRIIGSDFVDSRGRIDVSIYGNGDSAVTAKGVPGVPNYKMKCFKASDDNIYIRFPTGMSARFIVIGAFPVESSLPSGVTELEIASY